MKAWFKGAVVGLIAIAGLIVAAEVHEGFLHYGGFALAALCIFFCFRLIGRAYDAPGERTALIPVPDSDSGRQWLGGLAVLLGLAALFIASKGEGESQTWVGLLVAGLAWLYVFKLIGSSFGQSDSQEH